ncbi:hypothetical protein KIPB_001316, partial [Kipferlia bialata]
LRSYFEEVWMDMCDRE